MPFAITHCQYQQVTAAVVLVCELELVGLCLRSDLPFLHLTRELLKLHEWTDEREHSIAQESSSEFSMHVPYSF